MKGELKVQYSTKCPVCGHPASEHRTGRPGVTLSIVTAPFYYCNHAVPANEGLYEICDCVISGHDYHLSGRRALIRADAKRCKPSQ